MLCCIGKSPDHKAIDFPFSWYRRPVTYQTQEEESTPDVECNALDDAENDPAECDPASVGPSLRVSPNPDLPGPAVPPVPDSEEIDTREIQSPSGHISEESDMETATNEEEFNEEEVSAVETSEVEVPAPPALPDASEHLLDSQGFLIPVAASAALPERMPVVAASSQEEALDDPGVNDDASVLDDLEMSDDSSVTVDEVAESPVQTTAVMVLQEALPLVSALKKPKQQWKKIERQGPAKLTALANIPTQRPTSQMLVVSGKKSSFVPPSDPDYSKDVGPDLAPT